METKQGNNPELWEKLSGLLEDKLQMALLTNLEKIDNYYFEGETLFIEVTDSRAFDYLQRATTINQLSVYLQMISNYKEVKLLKEPS